MSLLFGPLSFFNHPTTLTVPLDDITRKPVVAEGFKRIENDGVDTVVIPSGNYLLALDSTSYLLLGTDANVKSTRNISIGSGTYNLSGQTLSLLVGYKLSVSSGVYTLTGTNSSLKKTVLLTLSPGSYLTEVQAASLLATRLLALSNGTYTFTGMDSTLDYTQVVNAIRTLLLMGAG